ncbi:hypothetical protein, partial [Shinella sumterensis]|uniref:hypothetical protein n=1 Tax=Shinella sumterensis TaxID=1967501 RepID=UPI003F8472C8
MRSEALPCLKEDKTASEERLGRAKAKPPHTPFPEATLSRGSPDCRLLINPAALSARDHCRMRRKPSKDWRFMKSPVKERQ